MKKRYMIPQMLTLRVASGQIVANSLGVDDGTAVEVLTREEEQSWNETEW